MGYLQVSRFLGLAIVFALVAVAVSTERTLAQTVVEITAADLRDDTAGADPKKAYEKVNAKIAASSVTGGTVVTFPEGEFKDVGEILIAGKKGAAATTSPAAPAKPVTFRGNGTVFTGKIMINVQDSEHIVIEGFTFRDTQVPDTVTVAYDEGTGITAGGEVSDATRVEDTGVVWLNTAAVGASVFCSSFNASGLFVKNITVRDNVFTNTARHGILARAKAAPADLDPPGNYEPCEESSAVTVSGNRFVGIGLGPNAAYLDSAKTVPGYRNRESAIEGDKTYGWTVTDNMVGTAADGEDARGTTANGIKLDRAFGKTVVRNNTVNNTAWSGIVVGGTLRRDSFPLGFSAEITIANNKVTNSRNDPYIVSTWNASGEGYLNDDWRFGPHAYISDRHEETDRTLRARVYKLPDGFTLPFLGEEGEASRLVTSIVTYTPGGGRPAGVGVSDDADQSGDKIPDEATVRYLRTGLEAGLELNRLTSGKVTVENNELTNNVVGLAVCPSGYCYADEPFTNIAPEAETVPGEARSDLKVPTVRNNRIYENRKVTDMPSVLAVADVVNGLTETDTGAGKNVLVLAGNYLGDYPRVKGAVNTDDLASGDADDVGLKEADPPGLDAMDDTGGAAFSGTVITLTYDEALDEESVPAAAAFTVTQTDGDGLAGTIDVSGVEVSGTSVALTLAKAPGSGNGVTVSYDPATAGSGTGRGPIRDVAGNEAPALTSRTVTASAPPERPGPPPATTTDDGGCALASGGSGGADLGMLLAMMVAVFVFGPGRNARKNI